MALEITQEEDESSSSIRDNEAERIRIRQIINYQKTLYHSSSSASSSSSTISSSSKSSSLLELMKEGSTSLRRLFDMEHTSLGNYLKEYSVSAIIKPILLWGSDTDDNDELHDDPWAQMRGQDHRALSPHEIFSNEDNKRERTRKRRLMRTKSYKRLPRFSLWRCEGFKFKLKLRKLRVMIRGRVLFKGHP